MTAGGYGGVALFGATIGTVATGGVLPAAAALLTCIGWGLGMGHVISTVGTDALAKKNRDRERGKRIRRDDLQRLQPTPRFGSDTLDTLGYTIFL